ncbi:PepSY1/2 domain-containing protein [Bacillaceae bacterium W0354]
MKFKWVKAFLLSSIYTMVGFTLAVSAAENVSVDSSESEDQVDLKESSEDSDLLDELITKVKKIFPEKFSDASEKDFELDIVIRHPLEGDDTERIRLSYYERTSKNPVNAFFEFTGDDLELTNFNFRKRDQSDALFPPKVTEDEALVIARNFIDNINSNETYRLRIDDRLFMGGVNQPLTEPIEYRFIFEKLKNGIPVHGQSISITVLGNGEVTHYSNFIHKENPIFESKTGIISKDAILESVKDNINIELQYLITRDYNTREETAHLTYQEVPMVQGVSAKDGNYYINGEYVDELPKKSEIKMLTAKTKSPKPLTKDEAKALAEKLLATDQEGITLSIDRVQEREEQDGTIYYHVQYMYNRVNGGSGSTISIKKDSGELLHFSSVLDRNKEVDVNISKEEALDIAVEYIQDYAYSKMNEYAYPISYQSNTNEPNYMFSFPRVKNGLIVNGDNILVGVSKDDGQLTLLINSPSHIKDWPSLKDVVSEDQAMEAIKDNLDLKLYYVSDDLKDSTSKTLQYKLRYNRDADYIRSFYDATTGEWISISPYYEEEKSNITISHSWAEDELNFMIKNKIIEVDNPETFDGDAVVTKGEALEILSKSLTRIYQGPVMDDTEESPFSNIDRDHELYEVIKRSVQLGIIDDSQDTFNIDEVITREQLAYWYVRALGLNAVAKQDDIFKYDGFRDANEMGEKYRSYVVLANSFGVLTKNHADKFLPKNEVTYAQLAVSCLRLAKLITSEDFQ